MINFFEIKIKKFLKMTKSATALQRITKFVKDNKISEMNQWSKRKLYLKDGQLMRYTRQLIKEIRKVLALLSGNDTVEMLKGNKSDSIKIFKLINL